MSIDFRVLDCLDSDVLKSVYCEITLVFRAMILRTFVFSQTASAAGGALQEGVSVKTQQAAISLR